VDSEQISQEMRRRRASIDRKLDALAARTGAAKRRALQRTLPAVAAIAAAVLGLYWWRRRTKA
jgi:hypothetical protein